MGNREGKRAARKDAMIRFCSTSFNIRKACASTGIARSTHYEWLAKDPDYATRLSAALDQAAQALLNETMRRAHQFRNMK